LALLGHLVALDNLNQTVEEIVGIVWASCSLWVILHRKCWDVEALEAFDYVVV
jgi:hypothetical protein